MFMATPTRTREQRYDASAAQGNLAVQIHALTRLVLRQGSSLMTQAEARAEAVRLYQRGVRA
jgi:hypothetical protein